MNFNQNSYLLSITICEFVQNDASDFRINLHALRFVLQKKN